jgi:hypothetical protein
MVYLFEFCRLFGKTAHASYLTYHKHVLKYNDNKKKKLFLRWITIASSTFATKRT